MNSGSFFRLDLETSKVVNGITFFNYIDIPELEEGKGILRYPIRLSISSDKVSIFVHYYNDDYIPCHTEEVILELPYANNSIDSLSSTIKRIYNTTFPLSNYLYNLLCKRYVANDNNSDYYPFQKSQINKDSYSSLYIWGLLRPTTQKDGDFHYEILHKDTKEIVKEGYTQNESKQNFAITKFLRKLLLDFMFDLMHSDVFECSKYYSSMKEGLMSDFFFSAIIKKSEYYYNRRLVRVRAEENLSMTNTSIAANHSLKHLYAEKLERAERDWIDVIMNPLADKHFLFLPDWYEDPEEGGVRYEKRKNKNETFNISESWFVNPEEEMSRIVFPLKDNINPNTTRYLNSLELCYYIEGKIKSSVAIRNTQISKWFYSRYDFKDTFRLHLFDNINRIIILILCLFTIFCLVSQFIPYLWETPRNFTFFPVLCFICLLTASVSYGISLLKNKEPNRFDDLLLCRRRKRECVKSFFSSMFFLLLSIFLWYFGSTIYHFVTWSFLLFIGFLLFLGFNSRNRIVDNIHLLLPRLVASIATAWIMIVIGNDIVKEHLSVPVIIIISVVVFVFVLFENNKAIPNQSSKKIVSRAFELMIISFSISVIIGIYALDILSPSLYCDARDYGIDPINYQWTFLNGSSEFTLCIFPDYLIPFSFLAMFIGVFIQMIFEEKSITEV